jgi:hypothetical protein
MERLAPLKTLSGLGVHPSTRNLQKILVWYKSEQITHFHGASPTSIQIPLRLNQKGSRESSFLPGA